MDSDGPPAQSDLKARIRRWLWLDRSAMRTDKSQANRGFYTGHKPVGWRFVLSVGALGVAIALVILLVRGADAQAGGDAQRITDDIDGLCGELVVSTVDGGEVKPEDLEQTRSIIEDRIEATGLADPVVRGQGSDRIEVALPGIEAGSEDADEFLDLVTAAGILEFKPVPAALSGQLSAGQPRPEAMQDIASILDGSAITSASLGQDETTGEPLVHFKLDEAAAEAFDDHAQEHVGDQFAIVLDGIVESAPAITATRYEGRMQIGGGMTPSEISRLLTVLRFGPLPLEIAEVSAWHCGGSSVAEDHGQRIEVPEVAVAVSYPSDWEVEVAPWDAYRLERHLIGRLQVMATDPRGTQSCDLYTQRKTDGSDVSLEDETEAFIDHVEADPGTELLATTSRHVSLPMGDASRVDFEGHGSGYSYWHVADGAYLHQLACSSNDPPQDRWRSIARTVETIAVEP